MLQHASNVNRNFRIERLRHHVRVLAAIALAAKTVALHVFTTLGSGVHQMTLLQKPAGIKKKYGFRSVESVEAGVQNC